MKRKIFTLLLSAFLCNMAMAQAPVAVVKKAPVAPVIDGVVDAIWFGANTYDVALGTDAGEPTLGPVGSTNMKALWTDEGIYILLTVNDDVWNPSYKSGGNSWEFDKPELYFDCNKNLTDGGGPNASNANTKGHYQVAPAATEAGAQGANVTDGDGQHAFFVTDPNYLVEYFVPFSKLKDADGADFDLTAPMGFDIAIIDEDADGAGRKFGVWTAGGAWDNMDNAGTLTFSQEMAVAGNVIKKTNVAPEIDGNVDAVWADANVFNIALGTDAGVPSVGPEGTTTWKALWNDEGMFVLLQVNDDVWYPSYKSGGASYQYDKPELYFDVNVEKIDGNGPNPNVAEKPSAGHYQWAPAAEEAKIDGTPGENNGVTYAFKVSDPAYVAEYFIPFSLLLDKDGVEVNKSIPMGFDVTIIDRDTEAVAELFAVWNSGGQWNNMDKAGLVIFDGTVEAIDVEKITVSGGNAISEDNGTLQMIATILPADATNQKVKWVVENTSGAASITKDGLLTAQKNGTVLVKAVAKDGTDVEGKITVTITGQTIDSNDLWVNFNKIRNGLYDQGASGLEGWGGWVDLAALPGAANPVIVDGVCEMQCGIGDFNWRYQHTNENLTCEPNVPYIFKFKSWASADNTPSTVMFEDSPANNWNRYGASYDAEAVGGRSEWHYTISMEPTWYIFHVTFDMIQETTPQKVYWGLALSDSKIYQDSVMLIKEEDLALSANVLANSKSKVQLYPNPVQTELIVSKIAIANSKVSVYNALGQKLVEKTANGTQAKFDVANLRKGMYFVRFSDGSSEKFIKE
jgi:hypothetical protein